MTNGGDDDRVDDDGTDDDARFASWHKDTMSFNQKNVMARHMELREGLSHSPKSSHADKPRAPRRQLGGQSQPKAEATAAV